MSIEFFLVKTKTKIYIQECFSYIFKNFFYIYIFKNSFEIYSRIFFFIFNFFIFKNVFDIYEDPEGTCFIFF